MTKEERLLFLTAQLAEQTHQDPTAAISASEVVQALGVTEKSFWNMFNGLARANFIQKDKHGQVWLTSNGIAQVERLRK
jgi:Mn-dependent DtxR family transcriptional regulator